MWRLIEKIDTDSRKLDLKFHLDAKVLLRMWWNFPNFWEWDTPAGKPKHADLQIDGVYKFRQQAIDGFPMQTAAVALRSGNSFDPQEKRAADKNGEKWPQKPVP